MRAMNGSVEISQVREALRGVKDPGLGKDIISLGMVDDIEVEEGVVRFTLALTTLACPLKDEILKNAKEAVLALGGARQVEVNLREMKSEEKKRIWPSDDREELRKEVARLNRVERTLAVMSGKGGVGKSSVAAMLAVELRRAGKRVGVLDADITGPSIPKMFGLHEPPPVGPLGMLPAVTESGIRVISINLLLPNEDEAVIWRGPLISGAIQQFWGEVVWGELDALVVDLPPGTSDAALTVMQSIPLNGVLLVTSPQDLAGMVVRKAARMAAQLKVPLVGLVENMSYLTCPQCGERIEVFGLSRAMETADRLGLSLLAQLPLDPDLARRCDAGQVEEYENEVFQSLAARVMERASAVKSTPIFAKG